jgi:hypothetical protein
MGKALWRFLLKKRDPAATVYVFAGQGGTDRRALSLALAVCDTMGLPRGEALFNMAELEPPPAGETVLRRGPRRWPRSGRR